MNNSNFGIYIHIPFCMSKCAYCSFVSKRANEAEIKEYFKHLNRQIKQESNKFKNRHITSIYFGGGTPSFVDSRYIVEVMEHLNNFYNLANDCEITIECNPCSITEQKLNDYKKSGINRISFGVQSLSDECLQIIGRKHNAKQAILAVELAKKCGFENISADLLIGIPNQTSSMLLRDVKMLVGAGVKHISAYMLMLEEGTSLYEAVCINKSISIANDDECVNMYNCAYTLLKKEGYNRYEISNFARAGYECKHNINYWQSGEYVGFGLSAYSFYDNKRIDGFNKFDDYYSFVTQGIPAESFECLNKKQQIEETLMLGLRLQKGISLKSLLNLGYDILSEKQEVISLYIKNQIIQIEDGYLKVADNMFGATNQIILNLLP